MRIYTLVIIFLFTLPIANSYGGDIKVVQVYTKFDVTAYSAPTFDSQEIVQIAAGTVLEVLSSQSAWLKIKSPNGSEGWLAKDWVAESKEEFSKITQQKQHKVDETITELEVKAKSIPTTEIYDIRNIYRELLRLSPGNPEYKKKIEQCEKMISKTVNFRQTRWGMSSAEVRKIEGRTPKFNADDLLVYSSSLDGKNVDIVYIFSDNSLVRTKYLLTETHTNKNDYIADYRALKTLLQKKYNKPHVDNQLWRNSLYEKDSENEGLAISIGHLIYYAQWKTTPTDIAIILEGDNYKITCSIEYTSNDLRGRESKTQEAKILEDI